MYVTYGGVAKFIANLDIRLLLGTVVCKQERIQCW
jgi:hypothetical protein